MRIVVLAVGRLRPPFTDDVEHYRKLLGRHARVELIEVREDEAVARRLPERAFVSLLHRDGEQFDSLGFSRFLEARRQAGRELCFVIGGPFGLELTSVEHRISLGRLTLPHQLARRPARAAVPRAQDPGRRAVPPLRRLAPGSRR